MTEDDITKACESRMLFKGRSYVRQMSQFPPHLRLILQAEYEALLSPVPENKEDTFIAGRFENVT